MNHDPSSRLSNSSNHPNESSQTPDLKNFCHPQYPPHLPFCQSSHAINFSHQQFPQQPLFPPSFHVVFQPQYVPFPLAAAAAPPPPPPQTFAAMPSASMPHLDTLCSVTDPDEQDIVNIENDENAEPEGTGKRMAWTEQEDLRLISAWLNNSNSSGMYWANVAVAYNSTTPNDRRREPEKLKTHWQKINKKIAHFFDCWCRVKAKYPRDQSRNMQLMDKTWARYHEEAWAMYYEEAKHYFPLGHCWRAVWDQPKWKAHIYSLSSRRTKMSESCDYTSSSNDAGDVLREETSQLDREVAMEKQKGKGMVYVSKVQDADYTLDTQTMLKKDHGVMAEVQLHVSDQAQELAILKKPKTEDIETKNYDKHTELLMGDKSRIDGIQMAEHEVALSKAMPKNETCPQHCKVPEKAVREDLRGKKSRPHGCKAAKSNRKGKGKASTSDVQDDIQRFMDLQAILKKDRQEMSSVQLRLSKENLEVARLKHEEAKTKKETVLYEKYTELLMADASRFNEFQKAQYKIAVRRMGKMLFGRDNDG